MFRPFSGVAMEKTWKLYILRCGDGSLYTGITTDVERRLEEHRSGKGAKYTRSRGPLELVYREECADKSAALKRELEIKALTRAEKLKLIEKSPPEFREVIRILLQFFCNRQQQDTDDDDGDKGVGLLGQFFFQEDAGQQQRYNTDRGEDGSSNGIHTAEGINVGELTGSFEYGCQDLILVLGNSTELDTLGLHEDEQAQRKQSKGQLIAGVCHCFDGFFGDVHKGRSSNIFNKEEGVIEEGTESVEQRIQEGHDKGNNCQSLAIVFLSGGLTAVFQIADTHNANGNDADGDPSQSGEFIAHENSKQQDADNTGGVFDGVRNGFFQKTHSKVGKCHGDNVEQGNGEIANDVDGIVANVLRQQGKDGMGTHNNTNPDTNLQVGILFVRQCTFFIKEFCSAP